ncbi:MAG: YfcC family protein [Caulobacter sp.]|nr:YfcC family protein [Caulobacter sp.]
MSHSTDPHARPEGMRLHPTLVMVWVLLLAALLTHLIPAGQFQRHGKLVVPGSYHAVEKVAGPRALLAPMPPSAKEKPARAASVVSLVTVIPAGLAKTAPLIFMVMFVGGMFAVMRATGAIDRGIDRLLHATAGNLYVLTPILMLVVALGSTFLGFISEYLVIIPIVSVIGQRMGLPNLFAMAVVGVAAKIGYAASVTNPVALGVAQPLAGLPVFSGMGPRLAVFALFLAIGVAFVLMYVRKVAPKDAALAAEHLPSEKLTVRQTGVLVTLLAGCVALVVGAQLWDWGNPELAAFYVALTLAIAAVGGLKAGQTADLFVEGMKSMMLAGLLIGLAAAVEIMLRDSQVLDTIIAKATSLASGHAPPVVANALMAIEMGLDVAIPSVSGKATLSIPILAPIAQAAGLDGQTLIIAFLLGSGLMNMVTPTSGMLLAYLATAKVGYGQWVRFVAPLLAILVALAVVILALASIHL